MFPIQMTFTVHNADHLNALTAAATGRAAPAAAKIVEAAAAKKSETKPAVATEPAASTTTAAATAAPEPKVEASAPASAAPAELLDKDALTAAVKNAIAKVGRDPVVSLISSYGAAKAGDVDLGKRAEFDAALLALAA